MSAHVRNFSYAAASVAFGVLAQKQLGLDASQTEIVSASFLFFTSVSNGSVMSVTPLIRSTLLAQGEVIRFVFKHDPHILKSGPDPVGQIVLSGGT